MFWACGVTPQAAAMASKPPLMITHAPGHMFITDRRDAEYSVLCGTRRTSRGRSVLVGSRSSRGDTLAHVNREHRPLARPPGVSALRPYLPADYCERAAQSILDHPGTVLIATGFYVPAGAATETDGPPGAIALGKAIASLGSRVMSPSPTPTRRR